MQKCEPASVFDRLMHALEASDAVPAQAPAWTLSHFISVNRGQAANNVVVTDMVVSHRLSVDLLASVEAMMATDSDVSAAGRQVGRLGVMMGVTVWCLGLLPVGHPLLTRQLDFDAAYLTSSGDCLLFKHAEAPFPPEVEFPAEYHSMLWALPAVIERAHWALPADKFPELTLYFVGNSEAVTTIREQVARHVHFLCDRVRVVVLNSDTTLPEVRGRTCIGVVGHGWTELPAKLRFAVTTSLCTAIAHQRLTTTDLMLVHPPYDPLYDPLYRTKEQP
jgi:hypothetical protein